MSWLARDLRVGFRALRARPGHTAASLVALGLGIGLTTATFSIVDGLLLRGLPFPESERLMLLGSENPARGQHAAPVDLHDFADWARRQRSFEALAAFDIGTATLTTRGGAERLDASAISAATPRLLRGEPGVRGACAWRGLTRPWAALSSLATRRREPRPCRSCAAPPGRTAAAAIRASP